MKFEIFLLPNTYIAVLLLIGIWFISFMVSYKIAIRKLKLKLTDELIFVCAILALIITIILSKGGLRPWLELIMSYRYW
jgi:hypothetical protein